MKSSKNKLWSGVVTVFKREVKLISADKSIATVIFLAPLFYAFFYGTIYIKKSEVELPICVVNLDKSQTSRTLIRNLNAHQILQVVSEEQTLLAAQEHIYDNSAQAIIFIEPNFSEKLKKGTGAYLKVMANTSRFLPSNDINKAINEVIGTVNASITLKYFESKGYNYEQAKRLALPISSDVRSLFNPTESYGDFFLPILLALILQQTLLIGYSVSVAKEREEKNIINLVRAANGNITLALLAKPIFYYLLFASYALCFFTVNFYLYKLSFVGSGVALIILTALFLASVLLFSFFISTYFKKKLYSLQFFLFSSFPFIFLSGCSWPEWNMPTWLIYFAQFIPSTPYLKGMIRITQMGADISAIVPEILIISVQITLFGLLGWYRLKVLADKE